MLFRTRDLLVRQRTQTINAHRGHLAEYGVVAPQDRARIRQLVRVLEDGDFGLPGVVVELVWLLLGQIDEFDEKIDGLDSRVADQRAGRRRDGTLLRMAVSVFVVADADAEVTDADRSPSSTFALGSRPTSRPCTSARTTDSSTRWIFAPSTGPNGGTWRSNWRSG